MQISQVSLLSENNEGNVRLFFFATMFGSFFLVISIIAGAPNYNRILIISLCALGVVFLMLGVMWPVMRRYLESRQYGVRLAESLAQLATSGWAWFLLVLFVGGSTAFLAVYNRSTEGAAPILVGLRHIETRIPSTLPQYPYGMQVVVQTDKPISGVIDISCDGPIGDGNFNIVGVSAMVAGANIPQENHNYYIVNIQSPKLLPETPLLIRLYSANSINVEEIQTR
jgi:hypothetical protein